MTPTLRLALLLAILGVLCGCATTQKSSLAATPKPQTAPPDSIETMVARLTSSNGLWVNGLYPALDLPATASTEQVVARVFQMTGFDKGHVSRHRILETRQVRIGDSFPNATYTAVLVDTDLGRKIVMLQHLAPAGGWWSRVYDG